MLRKTIAIATFCSFFYCAGLAQKQIQADATLTHATVYFGQGAELEHTAKASLPAGPQELVISQIGLGVDANTIQIACPENVTLLSYRYTPYTETAQPAFDLLVKKMEDSILLLRHQILQLENDHAIQAEMLEKTGKLVEEANHPDKTITTAELVKLIDYYTQKILTIKNHLFLLRQNKLLLLDSIAGITGRLGERKKLIAPPAAKTVGQLVMQVVASAATVADFGISYFTPNAGWLPAYDLRAKSIDNSLKLVYKASVTQQTGIGWKEIRLTLSTGNPRQGTAAPVLAPWWVDLYIPQLASSLNEVVVVGYGRKRMDSIDEDDDWEDERKKEKRFDKSSIEGNLVKAFTSVSESQLNVSYDIDLPYTIPSDGKAVGVNIKDVPVSAIYKHIAIPKLDRDAFLMARITGWESLSLLPGEASIIMDNVYLGKSFIDPNTTADTLNISLGRDNRIAVNRLLVKEFSKTKNRGDNTMDDYTYEITVKNNKTQAVELSLSDHYPLSKVKDIELTVTGKGGATVNEETGILVWQVTLAPGESKKFRYSYSVKYPRGRKINNM